MHGLFLKVLRNMFQMFQQVNTCFGLVPSLFWNKPQKCSNSKEHVPHTNDNTLTSKNTRNMFCAGSPTDSEETRP